MSERISSLSSLLAVWGCLALTACTVSIERFPVPDAATPDAGSDVSLVDTATPDLETDTNLADVADSGDDTGVDADAGSGDAGGFPPPIFKEATLSALLGLSPEAPLAPPVDPTNRYAGDADAIRFGQFLFFEPAISGDGTVSCASCHRPDYAFTDPFVLAEDGILGPEIRTGRRTPSLLNVAYQSWYFWDGRRDTLWGQALAPYESAVEMGGNRVKLARYIYATADVRAAYEALFGELADVDWTALPTDAMPIAQPATASEIAMNAAWEGMTQADQELVMGVVANVVKAIAAYEMALVSPLESDFDAWAKQVRANPTDPTTWTAMSPEAQDGARLFIEVGGCLECHKGPLMMDNMFHNIGVSNAAWANPQDPGRFEGVFPAKDDIFRSSGPYSDDPTGRKAALLNATPRRPVDTGAFKTPTLRNVARRAPYMHAGQLATLRDTVEFYNEPPDDVPVIGDRSSHVRALELTDAQVDHLTAFLEALDGPDPAQELREKPATP